MSAFFADKENRSTGLAFSNSERWLYSVYDNGHVDSFDLKSGRQGPSLEIGHHVYLGSESLRPDSIFLLTTDDRLLLVEQFSQGQLYSKLVAEKVKSGIFSGAQRGVVSYAVEGYSDGEQSQANSALVSFDIGTDRGESRFLVSGDSVRDIMCSHKGDRMACLVRSPLGTKILGSGGQIETQSSHGLFDIYILDTNSGAVLSMMYCHKRGPSYSIAWSYSDDMIGSCSQGGEIYVWNSVTGATVFERVDVDKEWSEIIFLGDSRYIVVSDLHGHIALFDIESGAVPIERECTSGLKSDEKSYIEMLPNSNNNIFLLNFGWQESPSIWDLRSLEKLYEFPDVNRVSRAATSYSGVRVAFACADTGIFVFKRNRPEQWWGVAWLPEFWLTVVFGIALIWSLRRDWKTLRGKKVEAKAVVETKSGEA